MATPEDHRQTLPVAENTTAAAEVAPEVEGVSTEQEANATAPAKPATLPASTTPTPKRRRTSSSKVLAAQQEEGVSTPRKRSTAATKRKTPAKPKTTLTKSKPSTPRPSASRKSRGSNPVAPPPTHILVIDNGGDTIKFGWSSTSNENTSPQSIPNVTARLQQQWTILVGDQLSQIQNPNQLIGVTRSMERGVIVNLGNQVQVWKRVLDLVGVNVASVMDQDTARAFGWKPSTAARSGAASRKKNVSQQQQQVDSEPVATILPQTCAVLLTVPPYCPRAVLDQITTVWMHDFGFSHVGFCTAPVASARTLARQNLYETACVVDLGWSATHIVPTHGGRAVAGSLRRVPLGARHLIKIWQFHCSYRQWNLMDQEFLLRDCLERTGYVSMDFAGDMKLAKTWPAGLRPFDRDYVLPDYQNTFAGNVRLPLALERRLRQEAEGGKENDEDEEEDDSSDEDVREEDMNEEDIEDDHDDGSVVVVKEEKTKKKRKKNPAGKADEDSADADAEDDDDEEEDAEEDEDALRRRLLKEREEEEKRKRQLELEQQVLRISVERFAIPETLFHPSDVGLPSEWAGLPMAIHQSIQACPDYLRAALYRSIYLTGGLSQLENLKPRLERELRALVPFEYEVHIHDSNNLKSNANDGPAVDDPKVFCWHALRNLAAELDYSKWSISRDEWEAAARRGAWRRLAVDQGGDFVV